MATHGGSIRQLITGLLSERDIELALEKDAELGVTRTVSNCSITIIEVESGFESDGGSCCLLSPFLRLGEMLISLSIF